MSSKSQERPSHAAERRRAGPGSTPPGMPGQKSAISGAYGSGGESSDSRSSGPKARNTILTFGQTSSVASTAFPTSTLPTLSESELQYQIHTYGVKLSLGRNPPPVDDDDLSRAARRIIVSTEIYDDFGQRRSSVPGELLARTLEHFLLTNRSINRHVIQTGLQHSFSISLAISSVDPYDQLVSDLAQEQSVHAISLLRPDDISHIGFQIPLPGDGKVTRAEVFFDPPLNDQQLKGFTEGMESVVLRAIDHGKLISWRSAKRPR